jgi:hypothetical protein
MTSMTEGPATACAETPQSPRRPARILRDLPQFRYLWLSKAISSTGTGIGSLQRGQLEPGRSLMEQAVDPQGLLSAGKRA